MGTVRFGEIELDPKAYELRRGGRVIRLERIPMQILLLLVERRPDLVTREQIAEKVWGPGVFVDTDNSINGAIRKLRLALKDDPENPSYIRTVTGMGYRFVAEVACSEPATVPTKHPHPRPDPAREPRAAEAPGRARAPGGRWLWTLLAPIALVLTLYLYDSRPTSAPTSAGERVMLAVLPFENLTGDPAQDYFADGFTEEMIARLGSGASKRLGVIARTSSMHYKLSPEPLETIGRELGVQYVLEGSIRHDADRVRITAQLIQLSDQSHIWSRQYDRQRTDVLTVQEEVAVAIADRIRVTLDEPHPSSERRESLSERDYMAYDLYLKGRYAWNKRTKADFERAVESFQRSIELNPRDARAHAGLADTYALMATYLILPREEVVPKARSAAHEALKIDPDLAAPYTSLALMSEFFDWDWKGAGERFRRAIEIDGNYATAHQWYAEYLAHLGQFEEALEQIELAHRLDPHSLVIAVDRAAILYYARRYTEAIDQFRAVMDVEPWFARTPMITYPYVLEERFEEALAQIQRFRETGEDPWLDSMAAYVYGRLGRAEEARNALRNLMEPSRPLNQSGLFMRTVAYCGMGLKEEVLVALKEACETKDPFLVSLKVDPIYDLVRDDPRFQDLLRCARLAS